ncbi:DMT family transporter [Hyphococcus luteus]|uniref:EamA/RhaT family transporter n=1 Tax=Hyphococcus luteus TaxID=2058213 RepID=A0A2S7K7N6_9PROT|nr:DMT family transporter [Marinicaulis flavus]PQA88515.1 EamA/RhaT family transporter [Marinicaulis flavus]
MPAFFRNPLGRHTSGLALAAGGAALFSLKGVAMKIAFSLGAGVEQMMTLRMGIALPFFLIIGWRSAKRREVKPTKRLIAISAALGVLSYYLCTWLDFTGLKFISAQLERLILFLYPTVVALFAWIAYGDRVTWRHAVALILSYGGVTLLALREFDLGGSDAMLGAGIVFATAVLFAFYVTASKPVIGKLGSPLFISIAMSAATVPIVIHSIVISAFETAPLSPAILATGLFLAIPCTVLPALMIAEAIARIGPGLTSATGGIGPAATALAAALILNEPFGLTHALALVLTVSGVMLLSNPKASTRAANAA